MSLTDNINDAINKYGFLRAGDLILPSDDELPKFKLDSEWTRKGTYAKVTGLVYVWCRANDNGIVDVAYVGKAGKTLKGRFSQHKGGFKGIDSVTGKNNASLISDWLIVPGNRIVIYARPSPTIRINDEELCAVSLDEESFILKFRRMECNMWNFQSK